MLFDGFDGFGLRFSLRDGDHHGLDGQHAVFLGSRLRLVLLWLDDGRHVFLLGLRDGGIGIKLLPGFAQEIGISLVDLVAEVFKVLLHRLVEIVEVGVEVAHEIIERLIGIVLLRTFSLLDFLLARHGGRVARCLVEAQPQLNGIHVGGGGGIVELSLVVGYIHISLRLIVLNAVVAIGKHLGHCRQLHQSKGED